MKFEMVGQVYIKEEQFNSTLGDIWEREREREKDWIKWDKYDGL